MLQRVGGDRARLGRSCSSSNSFQIDDIALTSFSLGGRRGRRASHTTRRRAVHRAALHDGVRRAAGDIVGDLRARQEAATVGDRVRRGPLGPKTGRTTTNSAT